MNLADVRRLLAYNHWATTRLLGAARDLSPEDFIRDLRSSHSSIRGTFVHLIGGHWVWFRLWVGEPAPQIMARCETVWNPDLFPSVASLEAAETRLDREQASFLEGLSEETVAARISFEGFQQKGLSLAEMIQHVVNHSTYHRGQVVTLLRQLGLSPPGTDYSTYLQLGPDG